MMTEKHFIVFLARPGYFFSFLLFGSSLHSLNFLLSWTEHEMMNCFCLNHASGMLRESFVMFFLGEKRTTIGEGCTSNPFLL